MNLHYLNFLENVLEEFGGMDSEKLIQTASRQAGAAPGPGPAPAPCSWRVRSIAEDERDLEPRSKGCMTCWSLAANRLNILPSEPGAMVPCRITFALP